MAVTRKLTIAGMRGKFVLRFRDIANQDPEFRSICGGKICVSRSANGTTYIVESDTDHFRVFTDIVTPNDMPNLFYWDDCTAYGWWVLDGYERQEFAAGRCPAGLTAEQLSAAADLGKPNQIRSDSSLVNQT